MIKLFLKFLEENKIRKRLIGYFLLITAIMASTSLYTYYNARMLTEKMNIMFLSNVYLNELSTNMDQTEKSLESYLETKNSESLKEYIKFSQNIRQKSNEIKLDATSNSNGLMLKDIYNMINTYLNETDAAVSAKRGRDIAETISHYNEAVKVLGYVNLYINKLNNSQLRENTARYIKITGTLDTIMIFNIAFIIIIVIFDIILILWFSSRLTKPIIKLAHSADEISKGNLDIEQVEIDTHDEISIMSHAFNRMTASIRGNIAEIIEKAELEGRLKEQEMQNLLIRNLLREAELMALQSQIKPHFIFNTLNAGAQVAILEGADKTSEFIINVADFLRYNLRKLDNLVTIQEEINNVNAYIYILKTRFADRIEFMQEIDESIQEVKMPCMILQPIVENAFIHGFKDMEVCGRISLKTEKKDSNILITIKDNGRGMYEEKVKRLIEFNHHLDYSQEEPNPGSTSGIGMKNVVSRLKIFYNSDKVLNCISKLGEGTEFIINIPYIND